MLLSQLLLLQSRQVSVGRFLGRAIHQSGMDDCDLDPREDKAILLPLGKPHLAASPKAGLVTFLVPEGVNVKIMLS